MFGDVFSLPACSTTQRDTPEEVLAQFDTSSLMVTYGCKGNLCDTKSKEIKGKTHNKKTLLHARVKRQQCLFQTEFAQVHLKEDTEKHLQYGSRKFSLVENNTLHVNFVKTTIALFKNVF